MRKALEPPKPSNIRNHKGDISDVKHVFRKFGKQIQKKQLEIPEYAASFVDYKALKKLIKELQNSPAVGPGTHHASGLSNEALSALQANKAPFFFRLDRELDKVNAFYTVKEEESKVRLRVLLDKQKSMRLRNPVISRTSTHYVTLEQGFRDFTKDLSKLQQFIEINATAFTKILKKWDKTSKSQTKELYLSRAVEVQPCFNRDVISELSDQANTALLDCAAWAEGEGTVFGSPVHKAQFLPTPRLEQDETDSDILDAVNRGDLAAIQGLLRHLEDATNASDRITKAFLTSVSSAPEESLKLLLETNMVDLHRQDEINDRNCLHKSAMAGRRFFLMVGLAAAVDPARADAYGRIPLHYACMNGHVDVIQDLAEALPASVDTPDLDGFTPLVHGIVHGELACIEKILSYSARVDPAQESDHNPLDLACQYGSVPVVELLLREQPQILPDAEGLYPQHLVARFGCDPKLLLMLQDYGADLDQPDKLYQWTPLFHAASEGKVDCLQTLLGAGVNPAALDEKQLPALFYASWEGHTQCMDILSSAMASLTADQPRRIQPSMFSGIPQGHQSPPPSAEGELIPDLSLPPPIIPTRRYGHNFLESKTTVIISFNDFIRPVTFYDATKYPAARLTIAPRSSDILARNILLPIQDEHKFISFEMNTLDAFAVDFDVYPTFGKKVIAKGSVPAEVFRGSSTGSGQHHLSLLDPRLRSVGELSFRFQVIKAFSGAPLDITPFATYWKATSQSNNGPTSLVTGSSLSGEFIRLFVQMSRDGVPILHPNWTITHGGLDMPVSGLTHAQFSFLGDQIAGPDRFARLRESFTTRSLANVHFELARLFGSLEDALAWLPPHLNVELHVLYPSRKEEEELRLGPVMNMNDFADSLLTVVFQHARRSRETSGDRMRSIVFTSFNADLCKALNWKQPNYPILICNDLGARKISNTGEPRASEKVVSDGRTSISIKEAVRLAQSNNFMGLMCKARLLDTVPALVESIKVAGLVLVLDASDEAPPASQARSSAAPAFQGVPEGVDGVLRSNGVLRFIETIDV